VRVRNVVRLPGKSGQMFKVTASKDVRLLGKRGEMTSVGS